MSRTVRSSFIFEQRSGRVALPYDRRAGVSVSAGLTSHRESLTERLRPRRYAITPLPDPHSRKTALRIRYRLLRTD
jgi:hypothetical protein